MVVPGRYHGGAMVVPRPYHGGTMWVTAPARILNLLEWVSRVMAAEAKGEKGGCVGGCI